MNYRTDIINKIKNELFEYVSFVFRNCSIVRFVSKQIRCFQMYVGIVGVFSIINCYFEYVYRIRGIFPYIRSYFEDMFKQFVQKCPRSVNNFRMNYLFEMFCDLWS